MADKYILNDVLQKYTKLNESTIKKNLLRQQKRKRCYKTFYCNKQPKVPVLPGKTFSLTFSRIL